MSFLKGWFGEKKTAFNIWLFLDNEAYQRYHNVIIPSKNGTTQIDHIIISKYGLFIVETKNKKGWIFGSEQQPKWTQSIYGKNYPFQNPLRQTFRQKKVLAKYLLVPESLIHTIIFFNGNCEFKTKMPENVINSGLGKYIKQYKEIIVSNDDLKLIIDKLDLLVSNSDLSNKDHLRSLRERKRSNTICPNCGANLVERVAKRGPNKDTKFLGCENYPKCRFTKNA
ncbi:MULTISPECIES: nuclease-related domain-containing protein [Gracilimonas]|uniref:NERD domain-containing protein n=1 Tax=Gracilimonas sediminicola TaxID=2952158 RepID=A0A9X2L656_9BACT|nr:NERD domain-containing protein [Gracilimonas sediminicola]MCP9293004.1 NERD domain-containing protein [Gracilimonas sediminicola]